MKEKIKQISIDFAASVVMGVAVNFFTSPNNFAPGGVTGLAVISNYLFKIPVGTFVLAANIPLLLMSYKWLGKDVTFRTLRVLVIFTVITDYVLVYFPYTYTDDRLLAAAFGGVFNGFGGGLLFMSNSTSGGVDIINRLIRKKNPNFSTGQLSLAMNAVVMILAAVIYKDINAALYGLVYIFVSTKVIDSMLNGADISKFAIITTTKPNEIKERIITELHRSATISSGKGAYLNNEVNIMLCTVHKNQIFKLRKIVQECDDHAFMTIMDSTAVIGKGFKMIN